MTFYQRLLLNISNKNWLDSIYNHNLTRADILHQITETSNQLSKTHKNNCPTNWLPNTIVLILASYIGGYQLEIDYSPSPNIKKFTLEVNDNTKYDGSDLTTMLSTLLNHESKTTTTNSTGNKSKNKDHSTWMTLNGITISRSQLDSALDHWDLLMKKCQPFQAITEVNFSYLTQAPISLISLLLYIFLTDISISNSASATKIMMLNSLDLDNDKDKDKEDLLKIQNSNQKEIYLYQLTDNNDDNTDKHNTPVKPEKLLRVATKSLCLLVDGNDIVARGWVHDKQVTISRSLIRKNQQITLKPLDTPDILTNNLVAYFLSKRGEYLIEQSVELPINSFNQVLSALVLVLKKYPILTYTLSNDYDCLIKPLENLATHKYITILEETDFNQSKQLETISNLHTNFRLSQFYLVKKQKTYQIYAIYWSSLYYLYPLLEQIRMVVMELQVKKRVALVCDFKHSEINQISLDNVNFLKENHYLTATTGFSLLRHLLNYKLGKSVPEDISYYHQSLSISADHFLLQLYNHILLYENLMVIWENNNLPMVYGGKLGNNHLMAISYMLLSELLNLLHIDRELFSDYLINIRIINATEHQMANNMWLNKLEILSPMTRRSRQRLTLIKKSDHIIVSGFLTDRLINILNLKLVSHYLN